MTKNLKSEKGQNDKEILTVKDVAALLGCSVHTVYNYIEAGKIKAVNIGKRMTRIKRSEIDKLFK